MADESSTLADTRLLQAVHKTFRLNTTRLVDATAKLEPADLETTIGPYWDFFSGILHYHHHTEDTEEFPVLAGVYPDIKPLVEELGRDHEKLVGVIDGIDAAVKDFQKQPDASRRDAIHTAALELQGLFFAHLDIEDTKVIPMFAKWIPADQWAQMDAKALRGIPKPLLPYAVGALDEVIRSLPEAERPSPPPVPVRVFLALSWRKKWAGLSKPILV